jgi:glycosyltransferase involved in cell wall biosynthesis
VLGTYRHWKEDRDDPSQVSMTYSGQFYDVVRNLGAETLIVSSSSVSGRLSEGRFHIEHCPGLWLKRGGLLYHLGQMGSSLRLLWKAWRFGAGVMVVASGSGHWFVFRLARLLGIAVIPTLHCVLWRKGNRPGFVQRFINALDRPFFGKAVSAILSASNDISGQIEQLTHGRHQPILEFLPTYRREQFSGLPVPEPLRRPFRVFYAGRIERDKGVFDLLEVARRFDRAGRTEIDFDLCGTGSALDELRSAVAGTGTELAGRFRCHGHCARGVMVEMFSAAHVVVVPTTTAFIEGFNQVVAEGVLSGRPVVTSNVCPAIEYVKDAVVEVKPDDVQGYGDAILELCDDVRFYEAKAAACRAAQEQFYDEQRGWASALEKALSGAGLIPSGMGAEKDSLRRRVPLSGL